MEVVEVDGESSVPFQAVDVAVGGELGARESTFWLSLCGYGERADLEATETVGEEEEEGILEVEERIGPETARSEQ
jgi:hypothetical protein